MQEQAAAAAAPAEAPLLLTQASQAGLAGGAAAPAFAAPGPSRSVSPALKTPGKGLGRKAAGSAGTAPGISGEDNAAGPAHGDDRADNKSCLQQGSGYVKERKRRAGSEDDEAGKAAAKSGSQLAKRQRTEAADRTRLPSDEGTLSVQCAQPAPAQGTETASAAVAADAREALAAAGSAEAEAPEPTAGQQTAEAEPEKALPLAIPAQVARQQILAAAAKGRRRRMLLRPKLAPKVVPFLGLFAIDMPCMHA